MLTSWTVNYDLLFFLLCLDLGFGNGIFIGFHHLSQKVDVSTTAESIRCTGILYGKQFKIIEKVVTTCCITKTTNKNVA